MPILRRKRKSRFAEYYQQCATPKHEPAAVVKNREAAHQRAVIGAVRKLVFARDPHCRACQGRRHGRFKDDEMHEIVPRSATRGLPPEERFNTANCLRLCHLCHQDVTEKRSRIESMSTDGADGLLRWAVVTRKS